LQRVETTPSGGPTQVVEYVYNDSGIRVRKIEDPEGTPIVTTYLVDSYNPTGYAQVIEEITDDDGTITRRTYTIGDDVIAQSDTPDTAAATEYLLYDGHGSTRQLSDSSSNITDCYSYDAYGVMLGGNPQSASATNLLYAGEHFDVHSQQYYNRARWYNPLNGRFNCIDPYSGNTQDPQSLHKYLYAHASPCNYIDPSGKSAIGGIVLAVVLVMLATVLIWRNLGHDNYYRYFPILNWGINPSYSARAKGAEEIHNYYKRFASELTQSYPDSNIKEIFDLYADIYPEITSRDCANATDELRDKLKAELAKKPEIGTGVKFVTGAIITSYIEPDNIIILISKGWEKSRRLSDPSWYDIDGKEQKKHVIYFYPGSVPFKPVGSLYKAVKENELGEFERLEENDIPGESF